MSLTEIWLTRKRVTGPQASDRVLNLGALGRSGSGEAALRPFPFLSNLQFLSQRGPSEARVQGDRRTSSYFNNFDIFSFLGRQDANAGEDFMAGRRARLACPSEGPRAILGIY